MGMVCPFSAPSPSKKISDTKKYVIQRIFLVSQPSGTSDGDGSLETRTRLAPRTGSVPR